MRILHINDYYEKIGGTEVYLYSLKSEFTKLGHEIFIFSHSRTINGSSTNVFIHKENNNKIIRHIFLNYFDPFLYYYLIRLLNKINPDIVHLHNCNKYLLTIVYAIKRKKIPIVQTVHDFGIICPTKKYVTIRQEICNSKFGFQCVQEGCISIFEYAYSSIPKLIKKHILRTKIDIFLTPSNVLNETIEREKLKTVVYLPNFTAIPNSEYKKNSSKNILFIGSITKNKGLDCLLSAYKIILQKIPDAKLEIYGTGGYEKEIKHKAKNMKLNNIFFHGRVSDDEIKKAYINSRLVAVPSIWVENSPIVVYEAMSYGKPVIASRIGGIPELVQDGQTGFLFNPNDANEFAEKTIQLLRDDKLTEFMGRNAQQIILTKFNKELHIAKLMGLYSDTIKKNQNWK